MKPIVSAVLVAVCLLAACGRKAEVPAEVPVVPADTLSTDSLVAETDSLEMVEEEPPRAADELFDDFIYAFMRSRKFQKSRVRFPLPETGGLRDTVIARADWEYDPLYLNDDVYTMIFNERAAEDLEKDTAVNHVVVEWVYLAEERVKRYIFDRPYGSWLLTAMEHQPFEQNANGDFFSFYRHFASDSLYQREHLSVPLSFETYDEESFEDINGMLDADQWFAFRPDLPDSVMANIVYGREQADTPHRYFVISSQSAGMASTLQFSRREDSWELVGFEN